MSDPLEIEVNITPSLNLAVGFDGDGDLDAVVAHGSFNVDRVWHNDGQGNFILAQQLSGTAGRRVGLGDLDMDGDLDAFVVTGGNGDVNLNQKPDLVWLNDGNGVFTDSGQRLGQGRGREAGGGGGARGMTNGPAPPRTMHEE